jgi:phenylacetate-coenzyme A ligase PaaK-like adenylate-forming protein
MVDTAASVDEKGMASFRAADGPAAAALTPRLAWDRVTMEAHRAAALGRLLRFAQDRSPWHAERLAGIDPAAVSPHDLTVLPTMTKAELMEQWNRVVTDPTLTLAAARAHLEIVDAGGPLLLDSRYLMLTTGGSTGEPGVFAWSAEERAAWTASALRWLASGIEPLTRLVMIGARSRRHASAALNAFSGRVSVPLDQPIPAIVERLNDLQPDGLFGAGSILSPLVDAAAVGDLRLSLRAIVTMGDAMAPGVAERAEAVFGVRPIESYPTTDVGTIASGSAGEDAMHVNDDMIIVEPVDQYDRAVQAGVVSHHLLVTSLQQRTLPLIRYRIDDRATFAPPGSRYPGFSRITSLDGRTDEVFVYGPLSVHPHVFRTVLSRHPEVRDYQVRQTSRGARISVVSAGVDVDPMAAEVADALRRAGLADPTVDVDIVQDLPRSAVGKRRLFVPL